jgi:hypothetical protein
MLKWESELWHLVGHGNGITCPLFNHCQIRKNGELCPYDHQNQIKGISFAHLLSTDQRDIAELNNKIKYQNRKKVIPGRIFRIVDRLATEYVRSNRTRSEILPISPDLIHGILADFSTEIRTIPLQAYHGAVWHLQDRSVIYLNANDTPDRQRLTLFHEAFHILMRSKAMPIIENQQKDRRYFVEMLADYFAGCIVMPRELVKEKWAKKNDIQQVARDFHVTEPAMWIRLEGIGLI